MKTLKSLVTLLLAVTFITANGTAQNPKTSWTQTQPFTGVAFCGTEVVKGTVTNEWKVWPDSRWQRKITWSLTGQTSGAHYEAFAIVNNIFNDMPGEGWNGTFTRTFHVKRNGIPIGLMHVTSHETWTPDGDFTSEVYNLVFECL